MSRLDTENLLLNSNSAKKLFMIMRKECRYSITTTI